MPENLVSRGGFSRPVPRRPVHLHTQAEFGAYSRDSSRFPLRRPFIYLNRHTPSGQSRVYRVKQLRTDGVHCRESAGTGPVVLKVVTVTGAAILQVTVDQLREEVAGSFMGLERSSCKPSSQEILKKYMITQEVYSHVQIFL